MAGVEIDAPYLASSLGMAEPTIQTLLEEPTAELVRSLLAQIEAKVREYDAVTADKLRADVQLESAVRTSEAKSRALKASQEKALREAEELRKRLNDEGKTFSATACLIIPKLTTSEESARRAVEEELRHLKSSSTTSSSEVERLQARIATLETSNRDTLGLVEAKSSAHDRLAEELSSQHQKLVALRREVSELEIKNQNAENAIASARFKEQNLQQEVDLLKRNNDWHENELKTRNAEHAKYRKEKSARIAELQRSGEDAVQTIETLRRQEATLRNRLEQVNERAEESLHKIQQLQEAAGSTEESFTAELENARRLADLHRQSAETARARLQEVSESLDRTKDRAAEEIGELQAELQTLGNEKDADEQKIAELEGQIEKLNADLAT
ncbi:MAG: hypothetical protein INR71_11320, partial [Terriglobus roseus]|nr:hypothetical protein [Terriglobus roseus]